jgi:hypothetical protein
MMLAYWCLHALWDLAALYACVGGIVWVLLFWPTRA